MSARLVVCCVETYSRVVVNDMEVDKVLIGVLGKVTAQLI